MSNRTIDHITSGALLVMLLVAMGGVWYSIRSIETDAVRSVVHGAIAVLMLRRLAKWVGLWVHARADSFAKKQVKLSSSSAADDGITGLRRVSFWVVRMFWWGTDASKTTKPTEINLSNEDRRTLDRLVRSVERIEKRAVEKWQAEH